MNIDGLRIVDKYIGKPLLWVFITLLQVGRLLGLKKMDETAVSAPKHVLIIKYFGMGSLLLASPAFRKIKFHHPDAQLMILTTTTKTNITRHKILEV